jgi:hypothetical protein
MIAHEPRSAQSLRRWLGAALLAGFASTSLGCAILRRPLALPPRDTPYVAVLSGEMPEPITQVARHAWIIANPVHGRSLLRYEFGQHSASPTSDPFAYFGSGDVGLHGVLKADPATITRVIACLDVEADRYYEEHPSYFPMPGPNSNTYVDRLLRLCDIHVDLPATAIGKDYRGILGASVTSGGTGVQLELWPLGIKLGLTEGIEVHLFGLSLGIDLWPPALLLPVNPGRLGFDDR